MDNLKQHADLPRPSSPDISKRMAKEREREQEQLNDLWKDCLQLDFTNQMRSYYGQKIFQAVRGWTSEEIKRTIEQCENGNINQIMQDINLAKMPDESLKIPDGTDQNLAGINSQKKGGFEEQIKQRAYHLSRLYWDNPEEIKLLMSDVLNQCKQAAEKRERQQQIARAMQRVRQRVTDSAQELITEASKLRVRDPE
jgi:hypothetical protein